MKPKILLFVPSYNCERQLARVVERVRHSSVLPWLEEVMIIDDCSGDGTMAAAMSLLPLEGVSWRVARTTVNSGLGGVHKAAFAYALASGFTHAVVLHGDDQGNIDDLLPMLKQGKHEHHSALLGSRFMKGARLDGYSRFRIFGNHVFNSLFSVALRQNVFDLGSGLNMFSREVMGSPHLVGMADDLTFNVHLLVDMLTREDKIMPLFFPVSWREDDQVSNVKLVRQTFLTGRIMFLSVLARQHFLASEHRAVPRSSYGMSIERSVLRCV